MEFLTFLILVVLLVRWLMIRGRFQELEEKLRDLERNNDANDQVRALTMRVFQLEQALRSGAVPVAEPAAMEPIPVAPIQAEPVVAFVEPPPLPVMQPPPLPLEFVPEPQPEPIFVPPPPPVPPLPAIPVPTMAEQMRERMSGQEWEALVGGNILNKVGALLLVIGLAFLLGFGFTKMGPAGRAATGVAVSSALLVAGILVERKELYRVFARGLIGAGWASLYFTAYAMSAVEATRVIENPIAGTIVLLTVAAAMITLRYGSQGATGVAYFAAFAALAVTPSTPLAAVALLPLAASLLYLAHRFAWYPMALFGLVATYGTLISRGDSGSPLASTQALLFFYWVLFEGFDLMRVQRRVTSGFAVAVFPLNTAAFLVLSLTKWSKTAPNDDYIFGMASAALYLASAVIRWRLCPPRDEEGTELSIEQRLTAGGYEASAVISSIMAALSIFAKVHGVWAGAALAVEAEILFLAGMKLRERLLERLSLAGFFFSLGSLAADKGHTPMFGRQIHNGSPVALLHVAIFYANRAMRAPGLLFSYTASILAAIVITAETPERFLGSALAAFGLILLEFGLRRGLPEFRYQGYGALACGVAAKIAFNGVPNSREGWIQVAIGIAIAYLMSVRPLDVPETESKALRWGAAISTSLLAMILAAKLVPAEYLGLTWSLIAVALLELGIFGIPAQLRMLSWLVAASGVAGVVFGEFQHFDKFAQRSVWASYAVSGTALYWFAFRNQLRSQAAALGTAMAMTSLWVAMPDVLVAPAWAVLALGLIETGCEWQGNATFAAVFGRLFLANFTTTGYTGPISHRILTVVPILAAHYHVWQRNRETNGNPYWAKLHLWAPAILAFVLLRFELGRVYTVAGWAVLGLALLFIGLRANMDDLKRQSLAIAVLTFLRSMASNFFMPDSLGGLAARLGIAACVIGAFYASQLLVPRGTKERTFYSLLATALLTSVIFHEVSGSMLTVAWGVEGILLLICGFPLRERVLRLAGLALLLFCILKLFLFDMRNLDTIPRILSFIGLGIMLMTVSWIYTRFRERINQYL